MSIEEVPHAEAGKVNKFLKQQEEKYYTAEKIPNDKKTIAVYIKKDKKIIGGMSGYTKWNILYLKHFYLDKSLRYQGMGMKILKKIITIAKARGCKYAIFTTVDVGAPSLFNAYECKIISTFDHTPSNHMYYMYRATL